MAITTRKQVILDQFTGESTTNALTHISMEVEKTATMQHGSLLKADGTEATEAEAADVEYILNEPLIGRTLVGEKEFCSLASRMVLVNTDALTYSDKALPVGGEADLTKLIAKNVTFGVAKSLDKADEL